MSKNLFQSRVFLQQAGDAVDLLFELASVGIIRTKEHLLTQSDGFWRSSRSQHPERPSAKLSTVKMREGVTFRSTTWQNTDVYR